MTQDKINWTISKISAYVMSCVYGSKENKGVFTDKDLNEWFNSDGDTYLENDWWKNEEIVKGIKESLSKYPLIDKNAIDIQEAKLDNGTNLVISAQLEDKYAFNTRRYDKKFWDNLSTEDLVKITSAIIVNEVLDNQYDNNWIVSSEDIEGFNKVFKAYPEGWIKEHQEEIEYELSGYPQFEDNGGGIEVSEEDGNILFDCIAYTNLLPHIVENDEEFLLEDEMIQDPEFQNGIEKEVLKELSKDKLDPNNLPIDAVYKLDNGNLFYIQDSSDMDFDFTLYDKYGEELDGGVYGDTGSSKLTDKILRDILDYNFDYKGNYKYQKGMELEDIEELSYSSRAKDEGR